MKRLVIYLITSIFCTTILLSEDLIIDSNYKVELVNNKISDKEANNAFNYVLNTYYSDKRYKEAIDKFNSILEHSKSNINDDCLFYIGKIYYYNNDNQKYIDTFRKIFYMYKDGDIVKTGQLADTLINIISKEEIRDFYFIMQVYHLLEVLNIQKAKMAKEMILSSRIFEPIKVKDKTYQSNSYKWEEVKKWTSKYYTSASSYISDLEVRSAFKNKIIGEIYWRYPFNIVGISNERIKENDIDLFRDWILQNGKFEVLSIDIKIDYGDILFSAFGEFEYEFTIADFTKYMGYVVMEIGESAKDEI
jgi:tetratricopeptide (TPR) repeat protein